MKQYTWEKDEYADQWNYGSFNKIADCIAEAKNDYGVKAGDTIYIGECVPFDIYVDAYSVLEQLQEAALDFAGECAEDWDLCVNKAEVDELSESLTEVVKNWLKKYNRQPGFYEVKNIRKVEV